MPFTVTINETDKDNQLIANRLTVTVDAIDLGSVFKAVSTPPPAPKAPRKDKGVPRAPKATPAATV